MLEFIAEIVEVLFMISALAFGLLLCIGDANRILKDREKNRENK